MAARVSGRCSRLTADKRARRSAGLRAYESEMHLTRGKCRAPRCGGRWGVTRATLDFAASRAEVMRYAHVECVTCGRAWYRVAPPEVTRAGYLAVRLTLIVPNGEHKRYTTARGRVVVEGGDESVVLADVGIRELDEAARAWRKRNDQLLGARERAKVRKAERDAAAVAKLRHAITTLDERAAEREREEREAAAREAAGG